MKVSWWYCVVLPVKLFWNVCDCCFGMCMTFGHLTVDRMYPLLAFFYLLDQSKFSAL